MIGRIGSLCVALAGFATAMVASAQPAPIVNTDLGRVRGSSVSGMAMFRGIPFAAPPVGPLRWRAAQPAQPWRAVRDATRFGYDCMQPARTGGRTPPAPTSEDCLTLNVVTPDRRPDANLPVMVWIHGGAFYMGSGREAMAGNLGLSRRGVVVVSLNYRVGRFGFFAHPAEVAAHPDDTQGNFWLSDQIAALQWIQRNIRQFGGDPGNVTIFGVSAGGSSVNTLAASPAAEGLFERVISHSGGGLFQGSRSLETAHRQALDVARRLGVRGDAPDAMTRLRAIPAAAVLAAEPSIPDYGAIIDNRLLRADIPDAFAAPTLVPRSYMAGSTSDEGAVFSMMGWDAAYLARHFNVRIDDVRSIYDPQGRLAPARLASEVASDYILGAGAAGLARLAQGNGRQAYLFRFDYLRAPDRGRIAGAPHGGDVPYVFGTLRDPTAEDQRMIDLIQDYWTNFARTGNPNGQGHADWPAYAPATPAAMVFGTQTAVDPRFRAAQLDYWFARWQRGAAAAPSR